MEDPIKVDDDWRYPYFRKPLLVSPLLVIHVKVKKSDPPFPRFDHKIHRFIQCRVWVVDCCLNNMKVCETGKEHNKLGVDWLMRIDLNMIWRLSDFDNR